MNVVRSIVILIALVPMAIGGRFLLEGLVGPGLYLLALGALLFVATLFERWRYRATDARAAPGWQRTQERFEDAGSGETLQVWYDPASGERHYVSENPDAQPDQGHRQA